MGDITVPTISMFHGVLIRMNRKDIGQHNEPHFHAFYGDMKPLLSVGAFKPLQNRQLFNCVKAARGSVLWPNDIDYCPDTLYMESMPI
jgi:hypothetical protein